MLCNVDVIKHVNEIVNENEHVNLRIAFLTAYFTIKLQKVNVDRKNNFF